MSRTYLLYATQALKDQSLYREGGENHYLDFPCASLYPTLIVRIVGSNQGARTSPVQYAAQPVMTEKPQHVILAIFATLNKPTADIKFIDVLLQAANAFILAKWVCVIVKLAPESRQNHLQGRGSLE